MIRLNYNLVRVLVTSKLSLPWTFNISLANPNLYHLKYHTLIITKFTIQLSDWKIALLIKLLCPSSSYIVNKSAELILVSINYPILGKSKRKIKAPNYDSRNEVISDNLKIDNGHLKKGRIQIA